MKEKDAKFIERLKESASRLDSVLETDDFIDPVYVRTVLKEEKQTYSDAKNRSDKITFSVGLVNKELKEGILAYRPVYESFEQSVREHNEKLLPKRVAEIGSRINPVEGRDLDTQQLTAIAYDVDTRLVIAGAGTGKTTTIIGLVKHLLGSGRAKPEDILLLSFTNDSVSDLKKRIRAETEERIEVCTFHRLGLKIIETADEKPPSISRDDLGKFIRLELERRTSDPGYLRNLNAYLTHDFESQKDESDFKDNSEYVRYLRDNPLITLKGESVKSYGEREIADFLAENGIEYEYEAPYYLNTANSEYGQYLPDFHIKGTSVYIEYFGTDRNGNVAPFMIDRNPNAAEEYRRGIEWKRELHRSNRTRLIELFAYERSEGDLLERLEQSLKEQGVELHPGSPEEIFEMTIGKDNRKMVTLANTFTTAITLIKGTGMKWDEVYPEGKDRRDKKRLKRMELVLKPIYDAYQKKLRDNTQIDFEDMLNYSAYLVRNGKFVHDYRYVIIDEYQDLSRSRYNLLRAMRDSKRYKLFCVGDDWQSIYRFNGCDVSYILNFERYWGPSVICKIETTYRFNGDILRLSSEFVSRNGRQHAKNLRGVGTNDCTVKALWGETDYDLCYRVGTVLDRIPSGQSVLFLGRYNHDVNLFEKNGFSWKPDIGASTTSVFYSKRPDLKITFMTIHGSKGLQADNVFIVNNKTGRYGFPSNRSESILIPMLLGGESTQLDEERRLFYVAMTRAKKALWLVAYSKRQSPFYKEIFKESFPQTEEYFCPICGGEMVVRKGPSGLFYGCSNFAKRGCKFTRPYEPPKR